MRPYPNLAKKFKNFIPKLMPEDPKAGKAAQPAKDIGRMSAVQDEFRKFDRKKEPERLLPRQRYAYENDSNYQKTNGGLLNYPGVAQNIKSVPRSEFSVFEKIFSCIPVEDFEAWIKVFHLYMEGVICQDELFLLSEDILTSSDLVNDELFTNFKNLIKNRDVGRRMNSVLCKATSELDYAKMTKYSFSYYSWDKFPVSLCQGRDELCKSVLNDKFISLPQGSELFKFKIKN